MPTAIGETLRTAREQRGLSHSQAAARTYIRESYLRALEEERFESLGEDVYVKGFLRNYAKALDVDPAPLLETYRARYEHPPPDEAALTGQVFRGTDRPLPRAVRLTAAAGTLVLVFALLAVVSQQDGGSIATAPTETAPPVVEEEADADDAEEPAEPDATEEPTDADPGDGDAAPEDDDPAADPEPANGDADGVEVAVAVVDGESWMRVTVDGDVAFEGILTDGTSETYRGAEEVTLRIGNAGAVHLSVNGEDQGPAGGGGEVVEHRYTAEETSST